MLVDAEVFGKVIAEMRGGSVGAAALRFAEGCRKRAECRLDKPPACVSCLSGALIYASLTSRDGELETLNRMLEAWRPGSC